MDIQSLKKYIHDNNKIEYVLSSLGCHNIKYNAKHEYYSAAHPDGDNPMGVVVYNNSYLNYMSYSRDIPYSKHQDIVSLIQDVKNVDFVKALKWLHEILDIEFGIYRKPQKEKNCKEEVLAVFRNVLNPSSEIVVDVDDIHEIDEEAMTDYVPLLHINWWNEGIMPRTRKKFGLCYSYKRKRMVIPLRYWADGKLLGFNQRTMVENWKELGISKYFITPSYQKSLNLYGLWENKKRIEKAGYIVIVESEKSVLKRFSKDDGTLVALQGKTMSEEQRRIIMSLNIREIVVCLDLDVPIEEVMTICEKFYRLRKVSFIFVPKDEQDKFGAKDSPCDADNYTYNDLFNRRIEYGENMHNAYLKKLKK